jgi:hypothetical protein
MPEVTKITPSAAELSAGEFSPQNIEKALTALHHDGLVVLENVVDLEHLEELDRVMVKDAKTLYERGEGSPFNYHRGNIQQDPPLRDELFYEDIYLSNYVFLHFWESNG